MLPAHSSCVRWLTATISPAVGAWCGGKLEVVVPESPLNKLALRRRFRAGRRGGGARRFFAGSGASCRFPLAGLFASSDVGLCWLFRLDILLRSGRAPRRCSFFDAKVSLRAASGTCGDFNGTMVPNRLVQVTQWPTSFSSSPTGFPAVRRRGHGRRRILICRISQGCVRPFLFSQGRFCLRGLDDYRCTSCSINPDAVFKKKKTAGRQLMWVCPHSIPP